MTRKQRKELRNFALFAAFAAVVFGITAVRLVIGNAGWIAATLAIAGAAYWAGWRMQASNKPKRLRANAAYGKPVKPGAYRGGSYPREPVTDADAVSAYPREVIRSQAAAGLASLGWPKAQTGPAITTALDTVAQRGPVTVKAVITEVLRAHDTSRNA
jgi:hypothetical protein